MLRCFGPRKVPSLSMVRGRDGEVGEPNHGKWADLNFAHDGCLRGEVAGSGFHGAGLFIAAKADVVSFEFAIKSGTADAEHLAGEGFVTVGLFEDAEDGHALHFCERGRG